ncbi:MAG TPA: alpha/beta fold hydrolase, partial [Burkholderiales bacterium]|nr:alpha/beta fold hydrolase [Burkholderiales bacterium]
SIDPDTGKPYGMRFPVVTIRDFVNVQKALADALGIRRFVAVAGASMGAMQAVEWGADYPGMVDRIIPVIGVGLEADPYLVATMQLWAAPIRLDPHWNGGDYYGRAEPLEGLAAAMELVTVGARSPGWAGRGSGRKWAEAGKNPAQAFDNRYAIEAFVDKAARERARQYDANSFLYLTKAVQLFSVADRLKRVKSRILFITSRSDLLALPEYTRKTIEPLTAQQVPVEYYEIDEDGGHVDGLLHIDTMSETIRAFLDQTP